MMKKLMLTFALLAVFLSSAAQSGTGTRRFEIDEFKEWSGGEATAVEIFSSGKIGPAPAASEMPAPADAIWSLAPAPGGVYAGAANSGKLFLFDGREFKELFDGPELAVTRVRVGKDGSVWFSAIPGAVVYRMKDGKTEKIVDLDEEYIWDFMLEDGGLLLATGPNGKIITAGLDGKIKKTVETGEKHVMTLLSAPDGKTYAGTSGEGLLIEITSNGYRVVHDFEEREVKALGYDPEGKTLVAAVNSEGGGRMPEQSGPRISPRRDSGDDDEGDDDGEGKGGEEESRPVIIITSNGSASRGSSRISGAVYAVTAEGEARLLVALPKRAAVDMAVSGRDVYVATDQEGKVFRCRTDRSDYSIMFDLKAAQALSLLMDNNELKWIGLGSPGGIAKAGGKSGSEYVSKVLDAEFVSDFGAADWTADGTVRLFTRTGNLSDPDRGWSKWQAAGTKPPANISSPPGRFIQFKLEWLPGSDASVRAVTVPYRIRNQAPFIDLIVIESANRDDEKPDDKKPSRTGPPSASPVRKLSWKVTNPDNDTLEFKLFFQPEGTKKWIPIDPGANLQKPKYDWNTSSLADGWYRIKIVATDAPSNAAAETRTAEAFSERFAVDNRPPAVRRLSVSDGKVKGSAVDSFSGVSGIQYSVDGGDWLMVPPADGVFDEEREEFEFDLPELPAGPHVVAVRAWDRAGNLGVDQVLIDR